MTADTHKVTAYTGLTTHTGGHTEQIRYTEKWKNEMEKTVNIPIPLLNNLQNIKQKGFFH